MNFGTDIKFLKGVGSTRAEAFYKLGISTVGALLRYYPRNYEDWSNILSIKDAPLGENCCIKATVCHTPTKIKIPGGMLLYKTSITDGVGLLNLTFFNNKYIINMLEEGKEYLFFGKIVLNKYFIKEMNSPMFAKSESGEKIRPIYPANSVLTTKIIEKCVDNVFLNLANEISDFLPDYIKEKYSLCSLDFAIHNIHFPRDYISLEKAKNRLIFDELFTLQLGLLSIKDRTDTLKTSCVLKDDLTEEFYKTLPFTLTNAQKRATSEAILDMKSKKPMSRLLQGDVGSGKTVVAAAIIYSIVKNGYQSAVMVPTEVLARQHFNTFKKFFEGTDIKVALLTGSTTAKVKKEIKSALANGEIDLIIGTHSLIQSDVDFKNLGFVVTDEQHRFGVAQRAGLTGKGENPHILVMSATPIPRTLGLILYGDLDVSILDELPKGRQKIETYQVTSALHERMYKYIKKHLDGGFQGYIVCPLVEEGENDLIPAEEYYKTLQYGDFQNYRLGLLHGKMKPKEKEKVMADFVSGKIQLLVSTIVIEVGVDVPNAVIIAIENAERFGLSQLHQLRGRVGRGKEKSACILISDAENDEAKRRFEIMCSTNDGFKIADEDLKARGPGDFFGTRQHGLPFLRIANILTDTEILMNAQNAAKELLVKDPELSSDESKVIKRQIDKLFTENADNVKS
ncbi:MAG: ATP-dependent DNA helicase RecG [Oscillospiraceae bacterium]